MNMHELTRELHVRNETKIVMLVADGLGGLPLEPGGKTELETAHTPNLDELARRGVSGGSIPVKPGITPGSGPGHLGLFGYDPLEFRIGRGAWKPPASASSWGRTTSRHAAISARSTPRAKSPTAGPAASRSEESAPLAIRLRQVKIPGVEVFVEPVKEHRFVVVFRGPGLEGDRARYRSASHRRAAAGSPRRSKPGSERTAEVTAEFVAQAQKLLAGEKKANGLTLRGFSAKPALPTYEEVYGLKAAAIAVYPMYKGLARLVGMEIVGKAQTLSEQIDVLEQNWKDFDFFFIHFKYTDSTGEDGIVRREGEEDRRARRCHAAGHEAQARRADRHRRSQHAQLSEKP